VRDLSRNICDINVAPHISDTKMKNDKHLIEFLLVSLLLIWSIFIFFGYFTNHSDYVIFFNIFDTIIPDIILLILLAFLAFCLGKTIIKFVLKSQLDSDIEFVFSSALGFIILSLGMGVLTFSHLLRKPIVLSFLFILVLISIKEIISNIKKIKFPLLRLNSNYEYILLFFLIIFIIINLLFTLTPPVGHDEQQYHLTAPLRYIQNGGFYLITNIGSQVNYPQNTEMLYTLALILRGDILAKLINFYFGILVIFLIHSISKRFFVVQSIVGNGSKPFPTKINFSGILPSAIFYCSWVIYYNSTRANVELAQTFFDGMALFSILIWLEIIRDRRESSVSDATSFYFYFSAISAGFALGIKYNSLFSIISLLSVLFFYSIYVLKDRFLKLIFSFSRYLIVVFLLFSPWIIKNVIYFKNPFEPFRIDKLVSLAVGLVSKPTMAENTNSYLVNRAHILYKIAYPEYSVKELLLVPYNATIYGEWGSQVFDSLISPFYLMFLPFIIFIKKKSRVIIAFIIYIVINYLLWLFIQPLTRYLTPLMPFISILIAFIIYKLSENQDGRIRFFSHTIKILILISIFIIMCSHILLLIAKNPVSYIFRIENKSKFLERNNSVGIQPLIEYINDNLNDSAKIYLLWEKRGYYLKRDYKEDTYGNIFATLMSKYNDTSQVAEELKKMGFTHILCDTNIPRFWFGSSYKNKINQQAREIGRQEFGFFEKMAENNLELLFRQGVLRLYEIK